MAAERNVKPVSDSALVRSGSMCHCCHKVGHAESRCREKTHIFVLIVTNEDSGTVASTQSKSKIEDDSPKCFVAGVHWSVSRASRGEGIIDSGATSHIFCDKRMISKLEKVQSSTRSVGYNFSIHSFGRGTVCLRLSVSGNPAICNHKNMSYAP